MLTDVVLLSLCRDAAHVVISPGQMCNSLVDQSVGRLGTKEQQSTPKQHKLFLSCDIMNDNTCMTPCKRQINNLAVSNRITWQLITGMQQGVAFHLLKNGPTPCNRQINNLAVSKRITWQLATGMQQGVAFHLLKTGP